jgi:GTP cyclohydrolase I
MPKKRRSSAPADRLETSVRAFLDALGPGARRADLADTPSRVAEAWRAFTRGYATSAADIFAEGVFEEKHEGLVLVRDIEFFSVCEHHLVPFFGVAHVAYFPDRRLAGLSKLARLVDAHARRLQVQERMTRDIARDVDHHLKPRGVAVQIEARHLCMLMRGVEQKKASVVTTCLLGVFRSDPAAAVEFRAAISAR